MPAHKQLSYVFNRATLKKGEEFEVRVPSMAGNGYEWQIRLPAGLTQVSSRNIPDWGDSRAKAYMLRAEEPGKHDFTISLENPGKPKPKQVYKFNVTVK